MRRVSVGCILAGVALALLVSGPVLAQTTDSTLNTSLGVFGNAGISVIHGINVVGDIGISHKNESGIGINHGTLTFGGRYVVGVDPSGTLKPFVEGLGGVGFLNAPGYGTQHGFTWGVGAGLDVMALHWAGIRAQINYFHTQLPNNFAVSEVRFGIGLALGGRVKVAGGWAPTRLTAKNVNPT
jgi:hypothetical protein